MFWEQDVWEGYYTAVVVKKSSKSSKTEFRLVFKSGEKVKPLSLSWTPAP